MRCEFIFYFSAAFHPMVWDKEPEDKEQDAQSPSAWTPTETGITGSPVSAQSYGQTTGAEDEQNGHVIVGSGSVVSADTEMMQIETGVSMEILATPQNPGSPSNPESVATEIVTAGAVTPGVTNEEAAEIVFATEP